MITRIQPRSGTAFLLKKNQSLKVIDPDGQQVSDLFCFNENNTLERLSSGRSIDYNESTHFKTGDKLYSNKSNVMLRIEEDKVESHDFILTPCSIDTFKHFYPNEQVVPGCYGNLVNAFRPFGIDEHEIDTTFNIFMHVRHNPGGKIDVLPPLSKPGDYTVFKAEMDLIVGLTSCSAGASNNYKYKPIDYCIY